MGAQDVGGVWRENYDDFGLQVPKSLYEFPGFPYPKDGDFDHFPRGPQVQSYIQSYAQEYGLMELIRFGTPVQSLEQRRDKPGWVVRFEREGDLVIEEFDYCVTCTGMYSGHPHLPLPKGAGVFQGEMRLPSAGAMQQIVEKEQAWKRSWMPASSARASIWQLHMMKYHDNLCEDMQVPCRRKGWNIVAEVFVPYSAADYHEVFARKA